ncbi:hypothetical protein [Bradyrhizobium sp. CCBAU 11357]|uniref:hypothetical protein n=1 Tax=Bradyrhizobium sp. CCBAU 11357 TaxID=1630808 RepID=UPI00230409D0|nr:hypothetical protein [Bradyrhizobium sp. CCBAU 11357]
MKPLASRLQLWEWATLKRVPLRRKKLWPDPGKVYDLERSEARFPAILRNFASQTPHIRQSLSSEQFCVLHISVSRSSLRRMAKTWMAGSSPATTMARRLRFTTHGAIPPRVDASVN